ncbi:MAG: alcohol dehydrogenase catalytic domain-containing protein [Dehalococcoidia bacterium]|nr:alcohol dehydrogenase catalytic domain-containing protein [Dehalococcoidia bacterium]
MQAIVLHGKNDLRYHADYPKPMPAPGEVLLRMTYTSICQTDIELWHRGMFRNPNTPRILGHEAAGIVEELGECVTTLAVGDRIAVENVRTCGTCIFCRKGRASLCENGRNFGFSDNGGLAEYAVWPANLCIRLPDNMTNEEAPLAEPTSVAVHAVMNSEIHVGDTAAVIGCGVVGLVTLQVLQAAGAKVVAIDPREQSLALAKELGATGALNPSTDDPTELLPGLTNGYGPDVVIETAGAPGTALNAVQWVRRGGRAVIVGFSAVPDELNFARTLMGEKTVMGSAATGTGEYQKAVDLIARGLVNVKPLISARVTLEKGIPNGFERMLKPEKDVFRILVGNG